MTTHLSLRLAWHDRGWDGHVCNHPDRNSSCISLPFIRETRDDARECAVQGRHLSELGFLPPCSRDPGAYAERGFGFRHEDPLEHRRLPGVDDEVLPYSSFASPYAWMREEYFRELIEREELEVAPAPDPSKNRGWVYEPERQRPLLEAFWQKIAPGSSLVFYYAKGTNPVDEACNRLLVGIGRIARLGPQHHFGRTAKYNDDLPVWSRLVVQDYPSQGVRIPYQEYLDRGDPRVSEIACPVPGRATREFSYVSEHVSDDLAVALIERAIQSIERVRDHGVVRGDWDDRLEWLDGALSEVWSGRGPAPGTGSVLAYLGFVRAFTYQRTVLRHLPPGTDPWDHVRNILDSPEDPPVGEWFAPFLAARARWRALPHRHALLSQFTRFEIEPEQVRGIADPDERRRRHIEASEPEIVDNPYLVCEMDVGTAQSDPVALETIDQGLCPDLAVPGSPALARDDVRRVRAVMIDVLKARAAAGDTVVEYDDLIDAVGRRFPDRRACRPDRDLLEAAREFFDQHIWRGTAEDADLVALPRLRDLESRFAALARRRVKKTNPDAAASPAMEEALVDAFGTPSDERERTALDEKRVALRQLVEQRITVLTGGAGTGKTSLVRAFLNTLQRVEGRTPWLLVAPTGKARVRLARATGRPAQTIHQFLLRQGWLEPETLRLRASSEQPPAQPALVVIDEASMLPVDLLGTLLAAVDTNTARRIVFVGDADQLPPIGPGRPFVDLLRWLSDEHPQCVARLRTCMRTDTDGNDSAGLRFASGYRTDDPDPGDDELLSIVARGRGAGDLQVAFWNDHIELSELIGRRMERLLGVRPDDAESFDASLGVPSQEWKRAEAWQILSPVRAQPFGVDSLNRAVQAAYHGERIAKAKNSGRPGPFGQFQIVDGEKVIQIRNRSHNAYPRTTGGLDYVANGEIGLVRECGRLASGAEHLDVVFSTQDEHSYRYWKGDVDENLELAYALTVHKAQGSDFDTVFLIVPQEAPTLSRELLYTGLTRFRGRLVLLVERDITPLARLRQPEHSETGRRSTLTFALSLRPFGAARPHLQRLIHRTRNGTAVRSKSEVIVADTLESLGISYQYEQPLYARGSRTDFRLPDFTVSFEGDTWYWEHLGMLSTPTYAEAWERKRRWYEENGYGDRLLTSEDGPDGRIDSGEIERTARAAILDEPEGHS